jgi:hypothetical protein
MTSTSSPSFYRAEQVATPDAIKRWCAMAGIGFFAAITIAATGVALTIWYLAINGDPAPFKGELMTLPLIPVALLYIAWVTLGWYALHSEIQHRPHLETRECIKAALMAQNHEYSSDECERLADRLMHLSKDGTCKQVPASKGTPYVAPIVHEIKLEEDGWYLMRYVTRTAANGGYVVDHRYPLQFSTESKRGLSR